MGQSIYFLFNKRYSCTLGIPNPNSNKQQKKEKDQINHKGKEWLNRTRKELLLAIITKSHLVLFVFRRQFVTNYWSFIHLGKHHSTIFCIITAAHNVIMYIPLYNPGKEYSRCCCAKKIGRILLNLWE